MNKETKIKIGVIGTGHLGVFHIEQLLEINNAKLVGIYDISDAVAKKVSKKYRLKTYNNLKALCKDCDAVSIVTTTSEHYNIANIALDYGCHLFIEKPITETVDQANRLILKAKKKIIQVGHIENFNPAFCAINTNKLNEILKKIGEESAEFIMACKDEGAQSIASEAADLVFHLQVALANHNVTWKDVLKVLARRRGAPRRH